MPTAPKSGPGPTARMVAGARRLLGRLAAPASAGSVLSPPAGGDASYEYKRVTLVVNPGLLAERLGRETLVCCGAARGMTSVVAYTLFDQGYFLGERLQHRNFEDVDMRRAIPPRDQMLRPLANRPDFTTLVAARNADYTRWGFKIPHAVEHVPELCRLLRDPVILLCVRNPVGTGKSIVQRSETETGGIDQIMHASLRWVPALQYLVGQADVPALICDMDIVRRRPFAFVRDLKEALDLEGDADAIAETIGTAGYKRAEARPGMTFVSDDAPASDAAPDDADRPAP
ncbi:hypothetical protein ROJ8625_01264 [Roseivivax jejudonensis]|uniref:Sulfotransferase family protein n=1 Tax=Roseivivax jejudonensis TaxID=1529041 RepID=A0A1X6YS54_9RHOB|nr:hypothetical protein [Roseivivax jejudonensis]SLN29314.1 hypothetical protein ROJ8625_01264 [Roseivivax jejudonensis]